ncbi:MAG: hypothetical protein EBZ47_07130, partial [Chlamydiae bacterium]|nr:hypothetical protein [Chlamydiota bacterium]
YLFNCRSVNLFKSRGSFFSNIYLFVGIIFVIIAQLLLIYSKYMNQVFHTYPLDISSWMICLLASFAIIPVFLVEKRALA